MKLPKEFLDMLWFKAVNTPATEDDSDAPYIVFSRELFAVFNEYAKKYHNTQKMLESNAEDMDEAIKMFDSGETDNGIMTSIRFQKYDEYSKSSNALKDLMRIEIT